MGNNRNSSPRRRGKERVAVGILIIFVGLFVTLSMFGVFGGVGDAVKSFFAGFFGLASYGYSIITVFIGIAVLAGIRPAVRFSRAAKYLLLFGLGVFALHIFTSSGFMDAGGYGTHLSAVYKSGGTAGGLLSALLAYPLMKIFTPAWALLLVCLAFLGVALFAIYPIIAKQMPYKAKKSKISQNAEKDNQGRRRSKERSYRVGSSKKDKNEYAYGGGYNDDIPPESRLYGGTVYGDEYDESTKLSRREKKRAAATGFNPAFPNENFEGETYMPVDRREKARSILFGDPSNIGQILDDEAGSASRSAGYDGYDSYGGLSAESSRRYGGGQDSRIERTGGSFDVPRNGSKFDVTSYEAGGLGLYGGKSGGYDGGLGTRRESTARGSASRSFDLDFSELSDHLDNAASEYGVSDRGVERGTDRGVDTRRSGYGETDSRREIGGRVDAADRSSASDRTLGGDRTAGSDKSTAGADKGSSLKDRLDSIQEKNNSTSRAPLRGSDGKTRYPSEDGADAKTSDRMSGGDRFSDRTSDRMSDRAVDSTGTDRGAADSLKSSGAEKLSADRTSGIDKKSDTDRTGGADKAGGAERLSDKWRKQQEDILGGKSDTPASDDGVIDLTETRDIKEPERGGYKGIGRHTAMLPPAKKAGGFTDRVSERATKPQPKTKELPGQISLNEFCEENKIAALPYEAPSFDLLNKYAPLSADAEAMFEKTKNDIESILDSFGMPVKVDKVIKGPTFSRYVIKVGVGENIDVKKIEGLASNLSVRLGGDPIDIAPIAGGGIGIDVANAERETIGLRELLNSKEFNNSKSKISFALGKDLNGDMYICDIAKMPHLLIGGATSSGKSVCINSLIVSILYNASPADVRFLMVDPKIVELSVYKGIPHMLVEDIITEPDHALNMLDWALKEMNRRLKLFSTFYNSKNINDYNSACLRTGKEKLPYIVIIIDELANLILSNRRKDIETKLIKLASLSRAAGIHMVVATQRPSVDVIPGPLKANLPSRISFSVASSADAKTIFNNGGPEKLLGRGDMLYHPSDRREPVRLQGPLLESLEVYEIIEDIKSKNTPIYDTDAHAQIFRTQAEPQADDAKPTGNISAANRRERKVDDLMFEALEEGINKGKISSSSVQRWLRVGWTKAGSLVDDMEALGLITPADSKNNRTILVSREELEDLRVRHEGGENLFATLSSGGVGSDDTQESDDDLSGYIDDDDY